MNPFTHLRNQVRSALEKESKLTPDERRNQQWQFLTTVGGVPYIVGKGGANTMFYMIGTSGKRKICKPTEILDVIGRWRDAKYAMYAICKRKDEYTYGPHPSLDSMKKKTPEFGSYLVGLTADAKAHRLFVYKGGLNGAHWVPFKKL